LVQGAIVLDDFGGWEFIPVNPIHEFPRTFSFIDDFLNFFIKKGSLDILNNFLEVLPIFKTS